MWMNISMNHNEIIKCEWILDLWILHHFANHIYRGIMNLSLAGDTHITSSDLSTHMAAVALGDLTELFPIN